MIDSGRRIGWGKNRDACDNAGMSRCGALMGGKEVEVRENVSSAECFALDFENGRA